MATTGIDHFELYLPAVADPKILKRGRRAEDNLSVPSSFISNAHNEIYALYTEKNRLFDKNGSQWGGGRPHRPSPFESATVFQHRRQPASHC